MKRVFFLGLLILLGCFSAGAQALLAPVTAGEKDELEKTRISMLNEAFKDNRFTGGYFLYLSFFHDFNIEAMESHTKNYKPEVSKRLIFYFLNGLDQVNDDLVANYFTRGISRMDSARYATSMTDFDQVLLYDPHNADAYINRAVLFIISTQYDQAQLELDKARKYAPRNPSVYFNQGVIQYNLGNKEAALKEIDSCIKLDPEYARAYFERGLILNSLGQNTEAIKVLRKARSLGDPDAGELIRSVKQDEDKKGKVSGTGVRN